jgi:hypothetical protein
MAEGGLDGISKLNWHFPEIFLTRVRPLLLSPCLASSHRNLATAKLALYFQSIFDVYCSSMGISNSCKLYSARRDSFSFFFFFFLGNIGS